MVSRKMIGRLSAFASGAVVALVMVMAREDVAAQPFIIVHTCASADGTMRLTEAAVPCAPGERRVRIRVPGAKDPDCKDDTERLQKLQSRLRDLEYRDRAGTLRGRRVRAPFEVVTAKQQRLMRIEEQNVTFYNHAGKPVVWIVADDSGGFLQAQTADGVRALTIGAQGKQSHLIATESDKARIDVGRRDNGLYGVQIYGAQDNRVVGFGQSSAGSGIMQVADTAGTAKVSMFISKESTEGTTAYVANQAGTIVGTMSAAFGGGKLRIIDSASRAKVEAGLTEANIGVVRTFPGNCHSGVGLVGVVPDCIVGKR